MARPLPPPAACRPGLPGDPAVLPPRCPRCGSGDLLTLAVGRRGTVASQAAFCAGLYDRERRRIVSRSCGYSGGSEGGAAGLPTLSV